MFLMLNGNFGEFGFISVDARRTLFVVRTKNKTDREVSLYVIDIVTNTAVVHVDKVNIVKNARVKCD